MSSRYWQLPQAHPIPHLHSALNVAPIRDFIYHLTDNFFSSSPAHPKPLEHSIGKYTLADLRCQYKKYTQKRPNVGARPALTSPRRGGFT